MLDTRDRQSEQRYMGQYDRNAAMRPYDFVGDEGRAQSYPRDRRATEEPRYANYYQTGSAASARESASSWEYENPQTYEGAREQTQSDYYDMDTTNNDGGFTTFDYDQVVAENQKYSVAKEKESKKCKRESKCSTKFKVLVGVYFSLVTLIVVMLLVNTIPGVGASTATASAAGGQAITETIDEDGYNDSLSQVSQGPNTVAVVPPYEYDTKTNWFDRLCDSFAHMFD